MNTGTILAIMQRMKLLIPLGYQGTIPAFLQKGGDIWIEQRYAMTQAGAFPACHLEGGSQVHTRDSQRTHIAQAQIILSFYDRWDQQPNTIDQVRAGLNSDLELVMAILEINENLSYGGTALLTSIPRYTISPYRGEIDETVMGLNLVYRTLTATVNILPYD